MFPASVTLNRMNRVTASVSLSAFCQVRHFSQRVLVKDRGFLSISGPDAKKLIQGLCTNDLTHLKKAGDCLPTAFLTSKGRIFTNAFIYQLPSEGLQDILVEVNNQMHAELKRYLSVYKLRAKANIKALSYQGYLDTNGDANSLLQNANSEINTVVAAVDPRVHEYGVRIIRSASDTVTTATTDTDDSWLTTRDLLFGIAEGTEISNRIPLECNLDLLNYISFNKGCYIGQELTARTRFKGLVRKRLVPFLVSDGNNATRNEQSFDLLHNELQEKILKDAKVGKIYGSEFSPEKRLKREFRVFKNIGKHGFSDYKEESSIGEIVHTNKEGTLGLAMINLEALFAHNGDFIVLNMPREEASSEDAPNTAATQPIGDEIVRYISTFKPQWFQGLDQKTNIKV